MDPSLPESVQRRDAQREMQRLEKRLAAEAKTAWTLRDWSAEWLDRLLLPDCSPVTISNYRYLMDSRILPILGDYRLDELTPAILTDWLIRLRADPRRTTRKPETQLQRARRESEERALIPKSKLSKPLAAKTALNYYGCLSAALAAAVRLGYLDHNPMDRVQRPRKKRTRRAALSEDDAIQIIRLLEDLPEKDRCFRLAVLLALLCGLRLGEVAALRYTDINWRAGTIDISRAVKYTSATGTYTADPKTDAAIRTITLPPSMLALLKDSADQDAIDEIDCCIEDEKAHRSRRYYRSGLIVHNRFGGPVNKDTPSKWFRRFADERGYPGITYHDLRHAHASILVAHNVDVAAIASRMGHSDASVTLNTYTHPFAARDQAAAAVLDQLLSPDPPAAAPTGHPDPDPKPPTGHPDPDPKPPAGHPDPDPKPPAGAPADQQLLNPDPPAADAPGDQPPEP